MRWPLGAVTALAAFAIPVLFARHRDWEGWAAALLVLLLATALSAAAGALKAGAWVALAASAGFAVAAGGIPGFSAAEHGLAGRLGRRLPGRRAPGRGNRRRRGRLARTAERASRSPPPPRRARWPPRRRCI